MSELTVGTDGHLQIDGCVNFRDAGGWVRPDGQRMRMGALYRSDDPIRLQPAGRRAVDALGLARVIDVRQNSQFQRGAGFLPPDRTFHRPLVDNVIDLADPPPLEEPAQVADLYEDMMARSTGPLADVLDLIGEHLGEGPVLVHCVYGKDRTGIIVALVQAALGMPVDALVAEYARSDQPTRKRYAWMLNEPRDDDPPVASAPPALFTAPAEAMAVLTHRAIDRHGSLEAWVRSLPLADGTIDRLRDHLLEPC